MSITSSIWPELRSGIGKTWGNTSLKIVSTNWEKSISEQGKIWKDLDYLLKFFRDPRDVDLYVGGVLEKDLMTFKRLLGMQFYHWKFGDRYYFEHSGQPGSFTQSKFKIKDNFDSDFFLFLFFCPDQLNHIRRTASMSTLLCRTTDLESIPSNPFLIPSKSNRKVFCNKKSDFNYNQFREQPTRRG